MKAFRKCRVLLLFCALTGAAFAASADEAAIRRADAAWSHAAETKDLDKCISFYADDASVFPFNAPIASGKDQIRALWSHLMSMPGFSLTFSPTKIEASRARDIAYETGTFELKSNDAQGTPTATVGKYVVVWKRGTDHEWKAVADIFNTDK
jgi:ketosteroid isomerase-like protein